MTVGVQPEDRPLDAILADLRSRYVLRRPPLSRSLTPRLDSSSDEVRFRAANELYSFVRRHFPPLPDERASLFATTGSLIGVGWWVWTDSE